jgi:hypothetical protein
MTRSRIIVLTLICVLINITIISPLMLAQATLGSLGRAYRANIGVDQAGNALLGGSEDETISSRTGRHAIEGRWWALALEKFIDTFFGRGHCRNAIGE